MHSSDLIRKHLKFNEAPEKVITYTLEENANGDSWERIFVAHNSSREDVCVSLPEQGEWYVVVDGRKAGTESFKQITGTELSIQGLNTLVAYKK